MRRWRRRDLSHLGPQCPWPFLLLVPRTPPLELEMRAHDHNDYRDDNDDDDDDDDDHPSPSTLILGALRLIARRAAAGARRRGAARPAQGGRAKS